MQAGVLPAEPIQRWALGSNSKIFSVYGADGDWVQYEDHLAALAKAREDERSNNFTPDDHSNGMTEAYQRGLDAAREAVGAALSHEDYCEEYNLLLGIRKNCKCSRFDALAAIDALRKEQP